MAGQSRRRPPSPKRGGCLPIIVVLIWLLVGGIALYQYVLRPAASRAVGEVIGTSIGGDVATPVPATTAVAIPPIGDGAAQFLPTAVAALPTGDVVLTEQRANELLSGNLPSGIDSAQVRFVPGEVQITLRAIGTDNLARFQVGVEAGQLRIVGARIDGPLGAVVSADELIRPLETAFNNEVQAQGRQISAVRVEQGQIVMTVIE